MNGIARDIPVLLTHERDSPRRPSFLASWPVTVPRPATHGDREARRRGHGDRTVAKTVDESTGCSAAAADVSDIITDNESFCYSSRGLSPYMAGALHEPPAVCGQRKPSAAEAVDPRTFDQCPLVTAARTGAGPGQARDR